MTGDRSALLARIADEYMANGALPLAVPGVESLMAETHPHDHPREIRFTATWPDGSRAEEVRLLVGYSLLGGLHREPSPKPSRLPAFNRFMAWFNTCLAAVAWAGCGILALRDWTLIFAPLIVTAAVAMQWVAVRKIYGKRRRDKAPARSLRIPMSKLWIVWAVLAAVIVLAVTL